MRDDAELHKLEMVIANFLRWGVALAAGLLAVGWLGQVLTSGDGVAAFHDYRPESMADIFKRAWQNGDYGIVFSSSGLGILVSLPICRVLLTAYLFIRQKDWRFAAMSLFVFAVLLGSFCLGIEL